MLDKVIYWMDVVSTAADVFLLLRLLMLRLQQTYTFITLYCAVTVVIDAGFWITGIHGPAAERLFVFSRFVMAFVFPLAAWDVFEGIQDRAAKIRRIHILRLFSGLTVALVFALLLSSFAPTDEESNGMSYGFVEVGILLWASAASASALFIWNVRRGLAQQQIILSSNTRVFLFFFLSILALELTQCLELLLAGVLANYSSILEIAFGTLNITLVAWCTLKLRKTPTDQPARQSESIP